jgi:GAF domain-containing protein
MTGDVSVGFVEEKVKMALQMLQNGEPQHKILGFLVKTAEAFAGDETTSSILILDGEGLLRNAASPGLPYDYLTAIDGLRPHPNVGTCASSAATGNIVVTLDFTADDKWAELRHLPLALGFLGAWSFPIKTDDGRVLGTFGTYFKECRKPSQEEIDAVSSLARVAARVLTCG